MFDSLEGGMIPICILATLVGAGFGYVRNLWLGLLLSTLVTVAIAYAWFWLPHLIWPSTTGDSLRPWDLIATTAWSALAVPTSIVILLVTRATRASKVHNGA
jgi:hypothetical protein